MFEKMSDFLLPQVIALGVGLAGILMMGGLVGLINGFSTLVMFSMLSALVLGITAFIASAFYIYNRLD
ncbi:hypothetical protein IQ22_03354 [Pseudomonas duriflava]|uniref:Uncharacterized protein n=1 Tax=Pseudomonas duriflava TaxID=459528 RepID=A0A562Q798_9PSED|nr:hypothetical protein [Pseudomonas duriflava]TWI52584.1 hypothetical protein IQ22_03354 [Pseudomonas duriflava]